MNMYSEDKYKSNLRGQKHNISLSLKIRLNLSLIDRKEIERSTGQTLKHAL
jgi:hypothetical protein